MLIDGTYNDDAGIMLAHLKGKVEATADVGSDDEVLTFCERLRGYTHEHSHKNWSDRENDLMPLPRGYRNLRVFDGRDGTMMGSKWYLGAGVDRAGTGYHVSTRPLTASSVVAICLSGFLEEVVAWHRTHPLPLSEAGLLDLVVDIETRPRKLLYDGTPLDADMIDWIARRAPRRNPANHQPTTA